MDERRLAHATEDAAKRLAAGGAAARADGTTITCTWPGGARVLLRNSLHHVPGFSRDQLVSHTADAIVRAAVTR